MLDGPNSVRAVQLGPRDVGALAIAVVIGAGGGVAIAEARDGNRAALVGEVAVALGTVYMQPCGEEAARGGAKGQSRTR